MKLKIKSFNIDDAKKNLIKKCIKKHPGKNQEELSLLLGMSSRTLLGMMKEYKINWHKLTKEKSK